MKKVYQKPQLVVISIKMRKFLLTSGEKMNKKTGSWDEDPTEQ